MDLGGEEVWGQLFGLVRPRKEYRSFSWPGSDSHGFAEKRGEPALAHMLLSPTGRPDARRQALEASLQLSGNKYGEGGCDWLRPCAGWRI